MPVGGKVGLDMPQPSGSQSRLGGRTGLGPLGAHTDPGLCSPAQPARDPGWGPHRLGILGDIQVGHRMLHPPLAWTPGAMWGDTGAGSWSSPESLPHLPGGGAAQSHHKQIQWSGGSELRPRLPSVAPVRVWPCLGQSLTSWDHCVVRRAGGHGGPSPQQQGVQSLGGPGILLT